MLLDGRLKIGEDARRRGGRSRSVFCEAVLHTAGVKRISLELTTDFDERYDALLAAYLDALGNVHSRYRFRSGDHD